MEELSRFMEGESKTVSADFFNPFSTMSHDRGSLVFYFGCFTSKLSSF